MVFAAVRWLDAKPFTTQLILLVSILDPLGAAGGYLLAPEFGIEPFIGMVYGLVAASFPLSLWVTRYAKNQG